ncbi:MAG TPA: hypothetical protein VN893_08455, partial [Bryobacteraceae bacterium]|nr:hypothetical protein [Bryobacteraceae bacterium]
MKILVLNGGSSTLKAQLFEVDAALLPADAPPPAWEARADWSREATQAELQIHNASGADVESKQAIREPADVF